MRPIALAGACVFAVLLGSACSADPGPSATFVAPFPPRPASIDLQGLDPCRSLKPSQVREQKFVSAERADDSPSLPGCSYQSAGNDSYLVQFLLYTPAERLLPGSPNQRGVEGLREPTPSELDEFGTVEARLTRGSPADCAITMDTGPTSSIQFIYQTLDTDAASPTDLQTGCDKARRFASLGLKNLTPG